MTAIKICGLTTMADVLNVAALQVNIIGLVFAPGRRRVSPGLVARIVREVKQMPCHPLIAGVFVNETPQSVNGIAGSCGLDIVQLSGDEGWEYCREIDFPIIKVIHVTEDLTADGIIKDMKYGYKAGLKQPFACMLDCKFEGSYGGSGHTFDWDIAAEVSSRFPLIVAGGLTASNVGKLIRTVRPACIDVSSGVETDGKKDISKIEKFIRAVRAAEDLSTDGAGIIRKCLTKGEKYVTR